MTRSKIDRLPVGALLLQLQSERRMVVTANNREELDVIGFSDASLPPSLRPLTLEYSMPKLLLKDWPVTRIA